MGASKVNFENIFEKLEDFFDIDIPDEDAENIRTVGDAVKYITYKQ